eukprot:sb/3471138/
MGNSFISLINRGLNQYVINFSDAGSFSSLQIDQISSAIAGEIPTIQLAPAVCQVIRSGNPRCHLILEQVSLLVLSRYAGFKLPVEIKQGMERPRLEEIIKLIAGKKVSEDKNCYYGEFSAMTTILDYHLTQSCDNVHVPLLKGNHVRNNSLPISTNLERTAPILMKLCQNSLWCLFRSVFWHLWVSGTS